MARGILYTKAVICSHFARVCVRVRFSTYFTENFVCFIKINKYTKQCRNNIIFFPLLPHIGQSSLKGSPSRFGPANGVEYITKITEGFSGGLIEKVGRAELVSWETSQDLGKCLHYKGDPAVPSPVFLLEGDLSSLTGSELGWHQG